MTWTYSDTLATDKDKVRFYTGDVFTADQQMSDEGIAALLVTFDGPIRTAAQVCRSLAARYSRRTDSAIDDVRKNASQRAKAYADRANELDALAALGTSLSLVPRIYAGGISIADKELALGDTDRVPPFFTRDMMESTPIEGEEA